MEIQGSDSNSTEWPESLCMSGRHYLDAPSTLCTIFMHFLLDSIHADDWESLKET